MLEQILPAGVAGEIVAAPQGAVGGVMAFEEAIVLGNAGIVEPGPNDVVLLLIAGHVDLQQPFEGAIAAGQLQQIVVQRRPGSVGDEPVGPHSRDFGAGHGREEPHLGRVERAVRIGRDQLFPEATRSICTPADRCAGSWLGIFERFGHADAGMPGEAVEQLAGRLTGHVEILVRIGRLGQMA